MALDIITWSQLKKKANLVDGKVPSSELPSYVDDVLEYDDYTSFPSEGEQGKIYVALDTNYTYRWSGSQYIQIGGQDLSLILENFAPIYDSSETYEEGELVIYNESLYICKDDIDVAEEFTPSHWDLIDVKELLEGKQDTLVNQENIKSINGNSLLGSGNLEIDTNQSFPSSWSTYTTSSYTTKQFCDVVNADSSAVVGKSYLGEVRFNDLPSTLVNAEIIVEIMHGSGTSGKVIHLILSSGNLAPYKWEYTYWNNGSNVSGWIGFQNELVSGSNIKTINNESLLGSGNIAFPQEIFVAIYGTTTYAEITQALSDGKLPVCIYSDRFYKYDLKSPTDRYIFNTHYSDAIYTLNVQANNTWGNGSTQFEITANKVTSISSGSTDSQYPSAKCVYDALQNVGGMTNPMTTSQDIIVGGNSGEPTRLAKGSNGSLLGVNASGNLAYTNSLPIITNAPTQANTNGLIIVVLSSEPATKYSGYLYLITE